jgi:LysR family transcriptional regulator, nitrogen assimilation regulatory protein
VPFPSLNKLELVISSRRHGLRRILDDAAAEAGFSLTPRLEIDTLSAICEVVASTDLVTILPVIALHASLAMGRIEVRKVAGDPLDRACHQSTQDRLFGDVGGYGYHLQ